MIIIHESQLPSLGEYDEATLHAAMSAMEILDHGVRRIDESKLRAAFRQVLLDWHKKLKEKGQADIAAIEERERKEAEAAQAKAIRDAADARLKQWVAAGFLEDQHNQDLLIAFFEKNRMSYSAYNLDVAIKAVTADCHWACWAPHLQPASEPPPAEEVLGRCKDGKKQLPLSTTEADLKKSSTAQVADWLRRKRAAENQEYVLSQHSHGVSF